MGKGEWPSTRILYMGVFKEVSDYKHHSKRYNVSFYVNEMQVYGRMGV